MDCMDAICVMNFARISEEHLLFISVYKFDVTLDKYEDLYNTDNGTQYISTYFCSALHTCLGIIHDNKIWDFDKMFKYDREVPLKQMLMVSCNVKKTAYHLNICFIIYN